jgi:hypothetical protein
VLYWKKNKTTEKSFLGPQLSPSISLLAESVALRWPCLRKNIEVTTVDEKLKCFNTIQIC